MQVVIIEQDYTFHNDRILHHWNVQLLGTSKVVARIDEIGRGEEVQVKTYGNHPGGNRYRQFETMDKATDVVLKWAKRRFK